MTPQTAPTYHVVLRAGVGDNFSVDAFGAARLVGLRMDGAPGDDSWCVNEAVWEPLRQAGIAPSQEAVDFFRFAVTAYSADLLVPHRTAFDRWSRHIVLYLPVADRRRWEGASAALGELLDFLSGDRWELKFRERCVSPPPRRRRMQNRPTPITADTVSLLSGGLDSAIGGADLLADGHAVAFVSHNAKSGGATFSSPSQQSVLAVLRRHFASERVHPFRFRLNPPAAVSGETESVTTTRSRSIIFFALGLLVASALDAAHGGTPVPLVVPENGLISLNVPLTKARLGSWSTRTTHPHTLAMLREAMRMLGLSTPILTPYATTTKGEMLVAWAQRDRGIAEELVAASNSCAHPNQSRFLSSEQRQPHCGTCVPCIIRRASTQRAGVDDGRYSFDLPSALPNLKPRRAADALAFVYALETRRRPAGPFDINLSGPLHVDTDDDLQALLRVYDAGMDEVAHLLGVRIQ
ncbi:MAG: Qat anti-phage system QueC-like protein QatC [Gemmatimonadota bacterium]